MLQHPYTAERKTSLSRYLDKNEESVQQLCCMCSDISSTFSDHTYHHYVLRRGSIWGIEVMTRRRSQRPKPSVGSALPGGAPLGARGTLLVGLPQSILFSPLYGSVPQTKMSGPHAGLLVVVVHRIMSRRKTITNGLQMSEHGAGVN